MWPGILGAGVATVLVTDAAAPTLGVAPVKPTSMTACERAWFGGVSMLADGNINVLTSYGRSRHEKVRMSSNPWPASSMHDRLTCSMHGENVQSLPPDVFKACFAVTYVVAFAVN